MHYITSISIFGFGLDAILIVIILGIPIFFLWRRFFRGRVGNTSIRAISVWAVTVISAPLLYIIIISAMFLLPMYYPNRDFDRTKWMNDQDERYEYAEDIIDSKMLIGKTTFAVEKILGNDHSNQLYGRWYYSLGTTPGAIDPDSMEILFKNGKVIDVIRHRHY